MAQRVNRRVRAVDAKAMRTRSLYAQGIAQGLSVQEASAYANSGGSAKPKKETVTVTATKMSQTIPVEGKAEAGNPMLKNLSPNWRTDMLWGQMRKLALDLSPEEIVRSRPDAVQVIEQALKDDGAQPTQE